MAKAKTKTISQELEIRVPPYKVGIFTLRAMGTTSMLNNKMSQASIDEMIKAQGPKESRKAKTEELKPRIPEEVAYDAAHIINASGKVPLCGFPAAGIKGGLQEVSVDVDGIHKTTIGRNVFIPHDLIPLYLNGSTATMKKKQPAPYVIDSRRVQIPNTRKSTIAHRPRFDSWWMEFQVRFNLNTLKAEDVLNLFYRLGDIGIGCHTEMKKGTMGKFEVEVVDYKEKSLAKIWERK